MKTYIESKLNPDGTYDHSEVIEAHEEGARVEWYCWHQWKPCAPLWQTITKYRAVIEDKPENYIKMGALELSREYYLEKWCQAVSPRDNLSNLIQDKFQSGNDTITLTRAEVNEVFPGLLK